jgi:hypothetical protein
MTRNEIKICMANSKGDNIPDAETIVKVFSAAVQMGYTEAVEWAHRWWNYHLDLKG